MKIAIIICALFSLNHCYAQQSYTFKEVGWSITVPDGFNVIDSAENAARNQRGLKIIEEANGVKADISGTRTLISASNEQKTFFNATLTKYDVAKDGKYEDTKDMVNQMAYTAMANNLKDSKIDSASSVIKIDGVTFDKFKMDIHIREDVIMHMVILSRIQGAYQFGITYVYVDERSGKQIIDMIENSKFSK